MPFRTAGLGGRRAGGKGDVRPLSDALATRRCWRLRAGMAPTARWPPTAGRRMDLTHDYQQHKHGFASRMTDSSAADSGVTWPPTTIHAEMRRPDDVVTITLATNPMPVAA